MGGELKPRVVSILCAIIIILLLSTSGTCDGALLLSIKDGTGKRLGQSKMVVGSRPPGCVNKCLSCRPCVATLVINGRKNFVQASPRTQSREAEDDGYYLLSWKCRCGDKTFQP